MNQLVAYTDVYRASPAERIGMIRSGVPARMAKQIITEMHLDLLVMFQALNLKTSTVNRKAARDETLSAEDGERVVGLARLVGQVEAMVQEGGDSAGFDAALWLAQWLREPVAALGGERPIDLLDTMEGQALVSATLARMESGAYA